MKNILAYSSSNMTNNTIIKVFIITILIILLVMYMKKKENFTAPLVDTTEDTSDIDKPNIKLSDMSSLKDIGNKVGRSGPNNDADICGIYTTVGNNSNLYACDEGLYNKSQQRLQDEVDYMKANNLTSDSYYNLLVETQKDLINPNGQNATNKDLIAKGVCRVGFQDWRKLRNAPVNSESGILNVDNSWIFNKRGDMSVMGTPGDTKYCYPRNTGFTEDTGRRFADDVNNINYIGRLQDTNNVVQVNNVTDSTAMYNFYCRKPSQEPMDDDFLLKSNDTGPNRFLSITVDPIHTNRCVGFDILTYNPSLNEFTKVMGEISRMQSLFTFFRLKIKNKKVSLIGIDVPARNYLFAFDPDGCKVQGNPADCGTPCRRMKWLVPNPNKNIKLMTQQFVFNFDYNLTTNYRVREESTEIARIPDTLFNQLCNGSSVDETTGNIIGDPVIVKDNFNDAKNIKTVTEFINAINRFKASYLAYKDYLISQEEKDAFVPGINKTVYGLDNNTYSLDSFNPNEFVGNTLGRVIVTDDPYIKTIESFANEEGCITDSLGTYTCYQPCDPDPNSAARIACDAEYNRLINALTVTNNNTVTDANIPACINNGTSTRNSFSCGGRTTRTFNKCFTSECDAAIAERKRNEIAQGNYSKTIAVTDTAFPQCKNCGIIEFTTDANPCDVDACNRAINNDKNNCGSDQRNSSRFDECRNCTNQQYYPTSCPPPPPPTPIPVIPRPLIIPVPTPRVTNTTNNSIRIEWDIPLESPASYVRAFWTINGTPNYTERINPNTNYYVIDNLSPGTTTNDITLRAYDVNDTPGNISPRISGETTRQTTRSIVESSPGCDPTACNRVINNYAAAGWAYDLGGNYPGDSYTFGECLSCPREPYMRTVGPVNPNIPTNGVKDGLTTFGTSQSFNGNNPGQYVKIMNKDASINNTFSIAGREYSGTSFEEAAILCDKLRNNNSPYGSCKGIVKGRDGRYKLMKESAAVVKLQNADGVDSYNICSIM